MAIIRVSKFNVVTNNGNCNPETKFTAHRGQGRNNYYVVSPSEKWEKKGWVSPRFFNENAALAYAERLNNPPKG